MHNISVKTLEELYKNATKEVIVNIGTIEDMI